MIEQADIAGKDRPFGRGLLLTIVTFGFYALYWHYAAYNELTEEADDEFPLGLYIACFVPVVNIVTQVLFMGRFIDQVNGMRSDHDLPEKLSLGSFLGWYILGSLIVVGPFVAYHKLQTSINEVWERLDEQGSAEATPEATVTAAG